LEVGNNSLRLLKHNEKDCSGKVLEALTWLMVTALGPLVEVPSPVRTLLMFPETAVTMLIFVTTWTGVKAARAPGVNKVARIIAIESCMVGRRRNWLVWTDSTIAYAFYRFGIPDGLNSFRESEQCCVTFFQMKFNLTSGSNNMVKCAQINRTNDNR